MDQMVNTKVRSGRVVKLQDTQSGVVRNPKTGKIYYAQFNKQDNLTHLYAVLYDGTVSRAQNKKVTPLPTQRVEVIDPALVGMVGRVVWVD